MEQTFPKGGKGGNLQELLEKCIKEFRSDPVLNQDERYLDIWIKYVRIFTSLWISGQKLNKYFPSLGCLSMSVIFGNTNHFPSKKFHEVVDFAK